MKSTERSDALMGGDVYRLLLRIALLGIELGDKEAPIHIAEVLQRVRPDLPHARGVLAMCRLGLDQGNEAVRELESTLADFPDFQLGRALLGVCLKISNRSGWRHHLDAVVDDGRDEFAVAMACEVLGRPQTEIEDAPRPAHAANAAHAVWA